jgi:glucose-1-phosphate adenylyltransferase
VLFSRVHVHSYCALDGAVILPNVDIGRHTTLKRVVVDKYCKLPEGFQAGLDPEADRRRFHVTPGGVTLITPEMLGQQIHNLR